MSKPFVQVAAGMILRPDGSLLLAQRPADKPWSGWWELPGGKIEPGESTLQALSRELEEELGIRVTQATPWVTYTHEYSVNIVRLAFCQVTAWEGEPRGVEGQALSWVDPHAAALPVEPLLPATFPPMRWIRLPDRYLVTQIGSLDGLPAYLETLAQALKSGVRLVQFREPGSAPEEQLHDAFRQVLRLCHEYGARCLVNSAHPESWWEEADGVHFRAADACAKAGLAVSEAEQTCQNPASLAVTVAPKGSDGRQGRLIGVSAHSARDLAAARALDADFVVLGHVLDTPSHPGVPGMGWERFAALAVQAGLPVFAIGGQSPATVAQARRHGAHGIAGIRSIV
jgi:8-oxo-dGTP diphosphatase